MISQQNRAERPIFPKAHEPQSEHSPIHVIWQALSSLTDSLNQHVKNIDAEARSELREKIDHLNAAVDGVRTSGWVMMDLSDMKTLISLDLDRVHKIYLKDENDKSAALEICIREGGLEPHRVLGWAAQTVMRNVDNGTYTHIEDLKEVYLSEELEKILEKLVDSGAFDSIGDHSRREPEIEKGEWDLS